MTIQTVVLEVIGEQTIHCNNCENTIRRRLMQLPGVQRVEASHNSQRIDLTLDTDRISLEAVREQLDWMGWQTRTEMSDAVQIGEAARTLRLNPKTIRYYEEIGLLPKPQRTEGGYRVYRQADVERIDFVRRARALDLSLDDIREILGFRDKGEAPCPYVLHLLEEKSKQIEREIVGLRELQRELRTLHAEAATLPPETMGKGCVCHIIENRQLQAER